MADDEHKNAPPKWRDICVPHRSGMTHLAAVRAAYELGYEYLLWNGELHVVYAPNVVLATSWFETDLEKASYIKQDAERTYCPKCESNPMFLLCPEDYSEGDVAFYICPRCDYIGHVGVGPVPYVSDRLGADRKPDEK